MAAPKVTAKHCKVCGGVLASNVQKCIHCEAKEFIRKHRKGREFKASAGSDFEILDVSSDNIDDTQPVPPLGAQRFLDWVVLPAPPQRD